MKSSARMPAIFIGHGSPMNAIEDNEFSRAWSELGRQLPRPKAILSVSAHWQTEGARVTAMPRPKTIYDFYGFPPELYKIEYPAPGAPDWAAKTAEAIRSTSVAADMQWGLDHGTWAPLCRLFPAADIPVFQLSLDRALPARRHYEIGRELSDLRDQGILIVGSGNIVHNLGVLEWGDAAFDWASRFDEQARDLIIARDHDALIRYEKLGSDAQLSIPTDEHYLPLLYILALQGKSESLRFFTERVTLGSISMRGFRIG
jgi:4,5-DOPA dioxygenase extradiol